MLRYLKLLRSSI